MIGGGALFHVTIEFFIISFKILININKKGNSMDLSKLEDKHDKLVSKISKLEKEITERRDQIIESKKELYVKELEIKIANYEK
jgi:septal ring factor EnvC (AmiA/AmiB activator)